MISGSGGMNLIQGLWDLQFDGTQCKFNTTLKVSSLISSLWFENLKRISDVWYQIRFLDSLSRQSKIESKICKK